VARDGQCDDRADNTIWNGREDDQWLERMLELRKQSQINREHADHQHSCNVTKAADLLFLLASKTEDKTHPELFLGTLSALASPPR